MADTLRDLFFKRALGAIPEFKRLIIETTGMADPGPIMGSLLNEPVISSTYRLDAVVVTIDSVYGINQINEHSEAQKQAAVADVLLITKSDLATEAQIQTLQTTLSVLNAGATQHQVTQGQIDPALIIDIGLFNNKTQQAQPTKWLRAPTHKTKGLMPTSHDGDISNFTITLPMPLSYEQLEPKLEWLCTHHGDQLLRLKGIIHADDQPDPIAIHAVHQTLYAPTPLEGWNEEQPISRLVLIGKGLDEAGIRNEMMRI
jgi:G3E family GTPase